METERNWFPAVLLGLSILLGLVFLWILSPDARYALRPGPNAAEREGAAPLVTEESYQAAVNTVLDTYATEGDAETVYDTLIQLRVPASRLSVHYELVIAFGKFVSGDDSEAEARLTALKAQNPWLNL